MAKSIITATAILLFIITITVTSFIYTKNTTDIMTASVASLRENLEKSVKSGIDETVNVWESRKTYLTYIINHRDIRNISESLLKTKQKAENDEFEEAIEELEVALFYIKALPENEKVTIGNIF